MTTAAPCSGEELRTHSTHARWRGRAAKARGSRSEPEDSDPRSGQDDEICQQGSESSSESSWWGGEVEGQNGLHSSDSGWWSGNESNWWASGNEVWWASRSSWQSRADRPRGSRGGPAHRGHWSSGRRLRHRRHEDVEPVALGHPDGQLLSELKLGTPVTGKVVNVTKFGVFLSFGGKRDGVLETRGQSLDLKNGDVLTGLVVKAIVYTSHCGRVILAPGKEPLEVRSAPRRLGGPLGAKRSVTLEDPKDLLEGGASRSSDGSDWRSPFELAEASEESEREQSVATESEWEGHVETAPQKSVPLESKPPATEQPTTRPGPAAGGNGEPQRQSRSTSDYPDTVPLKDVTVGQRVAGRVTATFESGIYVNFGAQRDGLMYAPDAWNVYKVDQTFESLRVQAIVHTKRGARVLLESDTAVSDESLEKSLPAGAHPDYAASVTSSEILVGREPGACGDAAASPCPESCDTSEALPAHSADSALGSHCTEAAGTSRGRGDSGRWLPVAASRRGRIGGRGQGRGNCGRHGDSDQVEPQGDLREAASLAVSGVHEVAQRMAAATRRGHGRGRARMHVSGAVPCSPDLLDEGDPVKCTSKPEDLVDHRNSAVGGVSACEEMPTDKALLLRPQPPLPRPQRRLVLGALDTTECAEAATATAKQERKRRVSAGWCLPKERSLDITKAESDEAPSPRALTGQLREHITSWAMGEISGLYCHLLVQWSRHTHDGQRERSIDSSSAPRKPHAGYADLLVALVEPAADATRSRSDTEKLYKEVFCKPPKDALEDAFLAACEEVGPTTQPIVPGYDLASWEVGLALCVISSRGGPGTSKVGLWREIVEVSKGSRSTTVARKLSELPGEAEVVGELRKSVENATREAGRLDAATLRCRCERWRPLAASLAQDRQRFRSLLSRLSSGDPYEVLSVSPSMTTETIRHAYLRLSRLAHPDRAGDRAVLTELRDAYALILDQRNDPNRASTLKNERRQKGLVAKSVHSAAADTMVSCRAQELAGFAQSQAKLAGELAVEGARWCRQTAGKRVERDTAADNTELRHRAVKTLEALVDVGPKCISAGEHAMEAHALAHQLKAYPEACSEPCGRIADAGREAIQAGTALERSVLHSARLARTSSTEDVIELTSTAARAAARCAHWAMIAAEAAGYLSGNFLTVPCQSVFEGDHSAHASADVGGGGQQPEEEDELGAPPQSGVASESTVIEHTWLHIRAVVVDLDAEVRKLRREAYALLRPRAPLLPFVTIKQKHRLFALVAEFFEASIDEFHNDLGRCQCLVRCSPSGWSGWRPAVCSENAASADAHLHEPWWGPLLENVLGFLLAADLGLALSVRTAAVRYAAIVDVKSLEQLITQQLFAGIGESLRGVLCCSNAMSCCSRCSSGEKPCCAEAALHSYCHKVMQAVCSCING